MIMTTKDKLVFISSFIYFLHWGSCLFLKLADTVIASTPVTDVASWFLNKFFPRHKIYVEIVHRGLRREHVYGWCDVLGETYRPREFLIELDTHMCEELYIKTLLHELTHLRQWVVGSLRQRSGKMYYGKECVEDYEYWYQPHEIEAREQEETLYLEYLD
jgi:hypothetical protein